MCWQTKLPSDEHAWFAISLLQAGLQMHWPLPNLMYSCFEAGTT